jgi:hypothetical protein
MFMTLAFAVLVGLASLVVIGPSVGEALRSGQELRDKRLFFRADGGATLCRNELKSRLNQALPTKLATITTASAFNSFMSTYVTGNDPAQFLLAYAYDSTNANLRGGNWTKSSTTQALVQPSWGQYQCTLTLDSRVVPVSSVSGLGSSALFRYRYTISGTATESGVTRTVSLEGAFSIRVQQDNFARYALFTNVHPTIYFTPGMNFYGPVHTNGELRFLGNPSAHFWDTVSSVNSKAWYGNAGPAIELAADHNGTIDVPTFDQGFNRGVTAINLPATTTGNDQKAIALTGISAPSTNGAYLGISGGAMTGGIFVKGDASVSLSVPSTGIAQYTITQGANTYTVQVNKASNQTKIKLNGGSYSTYTGLPNGMFYVDGSVTGLAGTLEKDTQVTVAATNDVTITGNLVYENYSPASGGNPPSAEGATNLMGIISWNKNIHIGTSAPDDVNIHATLMAPSTASGYGQILVDDAGSTTLGSYPNTSPPRGNATVLGGLIMNQYGAFGTISAGKYTGYARNYIYDKRMAQGMAPPYFPTTGKVVQGVTGLTDRPNWRQSS